MGLIEYPLLKGASSQVPRKAIIHSMAEYLFHEGKWRHASEFLEMIGLSVHILICPNGDIIRCRKNHQGAYHAKGNNVDTLGAEWLLEGRHDYQSFKEAIKEPYLKEGQFESGCDFIKKDWNEGELISCFRRHGDVDPKRKVDPGEGFPFVQFLKNMGVII